MDIYSYINNRVSVRNYKGEAVPASTIEKLVDAGRRAPSARAVEPWEFVVVTDKGLLNRLGEIANTGQFIKDAACCIAVFCKDTKYYLEDGCAATENILLTAHALGLGAVWLGVHPRQERVTGVRKLLGIPDHVVPVALVAIGHPAESHPRVERYDEKKVHRDNW